MTWLGPIRSTGPASGRSGRAPRYSSGMPAAPERIYYDGECGMCHRLVVFTLRREGKRELFRFAPLQGPTFAADVPSRDRATLPDSFAVRTSDGRLLVRSEATLHVLRRLGGAWRALAGVLGVLPRAVRDLGYDLVARVRGRLFARPSTACPLLPAELARRFDP